jgi:hypothetical protein
MPTKQDARIPLLLIQRSSGTDIGNRSQIARELTHGWRLILPAGWGNAFWKSFVFAGMRVGGLREQRAQHTEAGLPCFPYDFPGTAAYEAWSEQEARQAQEEYERRPPAKRPNYTKLQADAPFAPAFTSLQSNTTLSPSALYILPAKLAQQLLDSETFNPPPTSADAFALVRVRLCLYGRGVVGRCAMIYTLDMTTYRTYADAFARKQTTPPHSNNVSQLKLFLCQRAHDHLATCHRAPRWLCYFWTILLQPRLWHCYRLLRSRSPLILLLYHQKNDTCQVSRHPYLYVH